MNIAGKIIRRIGAEWREFRRWRSFRDSIRVFYGVEQMPGRQDLVSGGMVKCIDLAERFPSCSAAPNLLYLVSSALPDRRELMVREAQRVGGRVVLNQNGVAYPAWAGHDWSRINAPNRWVHARADLVIYQSEFCRRCAQRFLGATRHPGEVLYNPVDTDHFKPSPASGGAQSDPVLLIAGSHHDAYRVRLAIDVLRAIRSAGIKARLLVAGRLVWSSQAGLEARRWVQDAALADVVEFIGPYTQQDAPDLFRRAHVLIHLKVQDPCPRLIVEAMASGLPVVYSHSGGTPELVGTEAGAGIPCEENFLHITPPETASVVDAVMDVLSRREAMAQAARARVVQHFSLGPWLDAHEKIFHRLLDENR